MNSSKINNEFVLGSSSPRRKNLLKQIGFFPDKIYSPNTCEKVFNKELPVKYIKRITKEKLELVKLKFPKSFILTADTIVTIGRRILPKTTEINVAYNCLLMLSGRRHKVITGFIIYNPITNVEVFKYVTSIVKFKNLSNEEVDFYLNTFEWKGKAGCYAIQGIASRYINFISGSYSNIVGLPIAEVYRNLISIGYNKVNE